MTEITLAGLACNVAPRDLPGGIVQVLDCLKESAEYTWLACAHDEADLDSTTWLIAGLVGFGQRSTRI